MTGTAALTVAPADTTPPTGSLLINNNAVWTKTKYVTLTISCTDNARRKDFTEFQESLF